MVNPRLVATSQKGEIEKIIDSIVCGLLIGLAIYSRINNGFGLLTFLPVGWISIIGSKGPRQKAVADLVKERGVL